MEYSVGRQIVNVPSFVVRLDSQKVRFLSPPYHAFLYLCYHPYSLRALLDVLTLPQHIDFALTSPFGGGRAGRVKRKRAAAANKGGEEEEEE